MIFTVTRASSSTYPAPDVGGLPVISTLVKQVRAGHRNVLLLDAGDLNTGRPESNFFKAEPDLIGYNHVGYDAMTLGNHEFDNPMAVLKQQMDLAEFPFISANVKTDDGDYVAEAPYIIKEFDRFKVAVFGLTTKETEIVGNPNNIKGLVFEDEVEVAREMVAALEDKADVIIALTHLGIYDDEDKGSKHVAAQVQGIDLIIDGHSHTKLSEPVVVGGTPIVQAWQWGMIVGKGIFTITDGEVTEFRWEAIPVNLKNRIKKDDGTTKYEIIGEEFAEDATLTARLQPYLDRVEAILSEVIGTADAPFFHENVRKKETAPGDLVADSMLWYTQNMDVDFAIQNGGGIRADIPDGDIGKRVIYEVLPFDNSIQVLELKGLQVQELFDYIATIPSGTGAFPQVSEGVTFTIKYDSGTVEDLLINGQPVDPEAVYTIATNSYLASGGDGYKVFTEALSLYDTSVFQRDVCIEYIIHLGGRIAPQLKGRINLKGGGTSSATRAQREKKAA